MADVSGYTDYGRVWLEFLDKVVDDLDPRSTVIVLGDARTNGREPHAAGVRPRWPSGPAARFWINPEPRLYWNYGDSVMSAYEPFCDGVFECWTTKQLEVFVNALADLHATLDQPNAARSEELAYLQGVGLTTPRGIGATWSGCGRSSRSPRPKEIRNAAPHSPRPAMRRSRDRPIDARAALPRIFRRRRRTAFVDLSRAVGAVRTSSP